MISRLISILASLFVSASAFADGTTPPAGTAPGAPQAPGTGAMLVPFVAMFGIMYLFMIRPQQKKMKQQQTMLGALKEGDEVLTSSGILGTVKSITDRMVTLEIDTNVKLRVLKTQVSAVLKDGMREQLV
jgi:preprotein translocase subunit YajC